MRDVESLSGLIEAKRLGVLRQDLLQVEPGSLQQVAYGILILEPIHAPFDRTPLRGNPGGILTKQKRREVTEVSRLLGGVGTRLLLGRHLTVSGTIKNLHPGLEGLGIGQVGFESRQVEAALLGVGVMALDAVLLKKRRQRPKGPQGRQDETEKDETGKHERYALMTADAAKGCQGKPPSNGHFC